MPTSRKKTSEIFSQINEDAFQDIVTIMKSFDKVDDGKYTLKHVVNMLFEYFSDSGLLENLSVTSDKRKKEIFKHMILLIFAIPAVGASKWKEDFSFRILKEVKKVPPRTFKDISGEIRNTKEKSKLVIKPADFVSKYINNAKKKKK